VDPEVWFRIVHLAHVGNTGAPVVAYHEQIVEIALGPNGAFESGNIGAQRRTKSSMEDSTLRMPIFTFLSFMGSLLVPRDIGQKIPDKLPHAPEIVFPFDISKMPMISSALRVVVTDDPFSVHDVDLRVFESMRHVG
jgi:hypothetical protein